MRQYGHIEGGWIFIHFFCVNFTYAHKRVMSCLSEVEKFVYRYDQNMTKI